MSRTSAPLRYKKRNEKVMSHRDEGDKTHAIPLRVWSAEAIQSAFLKCFWNKRLTSGFKRGIAKAKEPEARRRAATNFIDSDFRCDNAQGSSTVVCYILQWYTPRDSLPKYWMKDTTVRRRSMRIGEYGTPRGKRNSLRCTT